MNLSLYVFFGLLAVLLLWDLGAILIGGYRATVSATLYKFSQRFPIIPFLMGVLMGHLFFPNLAACLP